MNKLFRKMLALLAAAILVGQTMLTSIITAADVEPVDGNDVDGGIVTDAETGGQKYHPGQPQGEQLRCGGG